jgi:hypothetical protein
MVDCTQCTDLPQVTSVGKKFLLLAWSCQLAEHFICWAFVISIADIVKTRKPRWIAVKYLWWVSFSDEYVPIHCPRKAQWLGETMWGTKWGSALNSHSVISWMEIRWPPHYSISKLLLALILKVLHFTSPSIWAIKTFDYPKWEYEAHNSTLEVLVTPYKSKGLN